MKITEESIITKVDIVNRTTGEITSTDAVHEIKNRYYSISKLTTRINQMDLFTIMEDICKSSNDIHMMNVLLSTADRENEIRISNQKALAAKIGTTVRTLQKMLRKMEDVRPERLILKMDTGVYAINPFIFKGKRVVNDVIETKQLSWEDDIDLFEEANNQ